MSCQARLRTDAKENASKAMSVSCTQLSCYGFSHKLLTCARDYLEYIRGYTVSAERFVYLLVRIIAPSFAFWPISPSFSEKQFDQTHEYECDQTKARDRLHGKAAVWKHTRRMFVFCLLQEDYVRMCKNQNISPETHATYLRFHILQRDLSSTCAQRLAFAQNSAECNPESLQRWIKQHLIVEVEEDPPLPTDAAAAGAAAAGRRACRHARGRQRDHALLRDLLRGCRGEVFLPWTRLRACVCAFNEKNREK